MTDPLPLSNKREVFWDDYLINKEKTTALHKLHSPTDAGIVMEFDAPWEGNSVTYPNFIFEHDGLIRMYYVAANYIFEKDHPSHTPSHICYAESQDGIHWNRPNLKLHEHDGSFDNNILLDGRKEVYDNFRVIRDDNPLCPPSEKYKGIAQIGTELWCHISDDGIHFSLGWKMTDKGKFDSLNNAFWDKERGIYHCYIRDFHGPILEGSNCSTRDIRYMWSKDFREWSNPVLLEFPDKEDYPLYTNCISIYDRVPQIFIGFPTRYIERTEWSKNYDRLCGLENRKAKMNVETRLGLALTDCIFMCSRNGICWYRYDEAFLRPGPENGDNWVYGDCYPAIGLLETSDVYGKESLLSMYNIIRIFGQKCSAMVRYTIRKDGFASLNAPYTGAIVTTKPFYFEGNKIMLNFSTSARGYLYVTLKATDGTIAKSCELFGDSTEREIDFDTDLSSFAGKETIMEIQMRDADLYAVTFQ